MQPSGIIVLSVLIFCLPCVSGAETVEYDLTIALQEVDITGTRVRGMTINGGIPGPVLRFTEGDVAHIRVHNTMGVDTSVHWHGVLVPNAMDGVPYVTFPPVKAGTTFTYDFPIRQSGTYWYHSHTDLQEQSGVYGAIVIEPTGKPPDPENEFVVLFSDWTDEDPHEVLRTLKRGSEWYSLRKGSAQSIMGAARLSMLGEYFSRELQRMPPMDISDVAYDRFLANGKPEIELHAQPGETVRLRVIDGSSTTNFHLEFAGGPVTVIAADGLDVEPFEEGRFLIAVAETYDVLLQVPVGGSYEFRATAHDGSGHASVWIGSGERHPAPDVPKPNLYKGMGHIGLKNIFSLTPAGAMGMSDHDVEEGVFDEPGMMGMEMSGMHKMEEMDHGGMKMEHASHGGHQMEMPRGEAAASKRGSGFLGLLKEDISSHGNMAIDGMDPARPWPPYAKLRSVKPTAFPSDRPVREIRLTLDGDMERYVWFINNKPLSESDSILIKKGEVVRLIMINRTMMHHPMHLHGHFFRVISDQGDYSPLKHTVDVAPMSTTVIEFDANESGDWFFHCHLLYHMKSGMARVVHYDGFSLYPDLAAVRPGLYRESWYFWGYADVFSNMAEASITASDTRNIISAWGELGWQNVAAAEWETLVTWGRYFNRFFTVFAGADLLGAGEKLDKTRAIVGFFYLLPLNFQLRIWADSDGGGRVNILKAFQFTPRLSLYGEAEYDTHEKWENRAGLSYTIAKNVSVVGQWHSDFGWGGGVRLRF
ncbi:MAG: multicopper oxidase domain-containing protein [Nitrospiraceae bacterium]|nr:multicopper oxidase domain-containing protein [Nitrospiraceae bacterium]